MDELLRRQVEEKKVIGFTKLQLPFDSNVLYTITFEDKYAIYQFGYAQAKAIIEITYKGFGIK